MRGIGILLVVLGHLLSKDISINNSLLISITIFNFIYLFHMPLFVVVAGFLCKPFVVSGKAVVGKLRTLLGTYLLWHFGIGLFEGKISGLGSIVPFIIDSFLKPDSPWFLFALFVCAFLLYIYIFLHRYLRFVAIVPVLGLLFVTKISYINEYLPYMLIGYFVRLFMDRADRSKKMYFEAILVLGYILSRSYLSWVTILLIVATTYLSWLILKSRWLTKCLSILGEQSLEIYLVSGLLLFINIGSGLISTLLEMVVIMGSSLLMVSIVRMNNRVSLLVFGRRGVNQQTG